MNNNWINFNDNIPEENKLFLVRTDYLTSLGYILNDRILFEEHFYTRIHSINPRYKEQHINGYNGVSDMAEYRYVEEGDIELTTLRLMEL